MISSLIDWKTVCSPFVEIMLTQIIDESMVALNNLIPSIYIVGLHVIQIILAAYVSLAQSHGST
jgi:hypothetical protein